MTDKEKKKYQNKNGRPCIYKFENLINNKVYVGSGTGHFARKGKHLYKLRNNIHDSPIFQSEWNEFGEINFKFEVIEFVDLDTIDNKEQLYIKEQYWIDTLEALNPLKGYNKAPFAGTNRGTTRSEEARRKMSIAKKGKKFSKEVIAKRVLSQYKKVYQYDLNGNFIKEFISMQHAALEIKRSYTTISKATDNNTRTAGGFKWKFNNV